MMRTIEVLIAIIIITGAFIISSFYATLPWPREVSPVNLKRLALTTLQMLDSDYCLSLAAFDDNASSPLWSDLQVALSSALPPNIVYNLTVYEVGVNENGAELYVQKRFISNAESLGLTTDSSSYMVASSNVTFNVIPEKIGEREGGGTLYILNCSDAPGWWITGYTAYSLADDLYGLLSPYFVKTIMVQNTTQLGMILNGTSLQNETLRNAVIINTCGEAVPLPISYYNSSDIGYDSGNNTYALYAYTLGKRVAEYNWTWVSIVGYPFYYVSNTELFKNTQNSWGIYGMRMIGKDGDEGPSGLNAFLQGLAGMNYTYNSTSITGSPGVVYLSSRVLDKSNYYGIYVAPYQTSTRALPKSILVTYNLTITTYVFNTVGDYIPAAVYRHTSANGTYQGAFYAIGLTRTPDIRIAALGILTEYSPRLYNAEYTAYGTSRLVILQLGLVGGV
ncbi:MAG: hypothetical protein QXX34_05770 [Candidatus Bathyarchaeia archaeon]